MLLLLRLKLAEVERRVRIELVSVIVPIIPSCHQLVLVLASSLLLLLLLESLLLLLMHFVDSFLFRPFLLLLVMLLIAAFLLLLVVKLLLLQISIIYCTIHIVVIVIFILWLLVLHRLVRNNGHVGTQLLDEVVRIMHLLLLLLHDIVSILVDELLFAELFFAHNLLLFHLLNLLLERLLHVQTQTCNYHLLLINVFHEQEVVDA